MDDNKRKFYYERHHYDDNPENEGGLNDGPLKFVIFEIKNSNENYRIDEMVAWCYDEEFANFMVDQLNGTLK